ncbi:MAG: sulfotransferase [Anaerolineae bacterium]|nr:sulfotransferase [Anaerolineae bacterium]
MDSKSPIVVTGSHRSGTTWVGKTLCLSNELGYIFEPFRPASDARGPAWADVPFVYQHIGRENENAFQPMVEALLDMHYPVRSQIKAVRNPRHVARLGRTYVASLIYRARGLRPLIKDPFTIFSIEWLVDRFGVQPVVMIRHPAAFAGSLKRLGWTFDFNQWMAQPLLIQRYLQPFASDIAEYCNGERDIIDQSILLWNGIHHAICLYQQRHKNWTFLRYEDLAGNPEMGFQELYRTLGLSWNNAVKDQIVRNTSSDNAPEAVAGDWRLSARDSRASRNTWHTRLMSNDVERIKSGTEPIWTSFYSEDDWV